MQMFYTKPNIKVISSLTPTGTTMPPSVPKIKLSAQLAPVIGPANGVCGYGHEREPATLKT